MMRRIRNLLRDRRGVASVEMALMTPVVFALMFTCFEGGYYLWTEHKVIKGVRQGARYAARLPFTSYDCASTAPTGTTDIPLDNIKNVVRTGLPSGLAYPKVKGWTNSDITITVSCDSSTTTGLYKDVTGGAPRVMVSTVVTYPAILGLLGFDTSNVKVRAQAQAAVAGV
jgi:Flp pilus assembly protein TadG